MLIYHSNQKVVIQGNIELVTVKGDKYVHNFAISNCKDYYIIEHSPSFIYYEHLIVLIHILPLYHTWWCYIFVPCLTISKLDHELYQDQDLTVTEDKVKPLAKEHLVVEMIMYG